MVTTEKSGGYHLEGLGSIKGYILNRFFSTWLAGEAEETCLDEYRQKLGPQGPKLYKKFFFYFSCFGFLYDRSWDARHSYSFQYKVLRIR